VPTTHGERRYALKHASKNAIGVDSDHSALREAMGCRYETRPFSALDPRSRMQVERVI
jgi:hypothetical protein